MTPGSRRQAALATLVGTGGSVLITVGQAFLLVPLCLAYLGAHVYGAWVGASELLVWIQLLDLGLSNLLTQRIGAAVGRSDHDEAGGWAATGLALLLGVAVVLGALTWVAAPLVTRWADVPADDVPAFTASFRTAGIASALLLLSNGVVGVSRGVQLTGVLSAAQIAGALLGLVSSAALLVAGFGIWALSLGLLGRAIVTLAGAAVFLVQVRRRTGVPLRAPSAPLAREAGALMPSMAAGSAGYLLATSTEILLVTTIFGPVTALVYALTRRTMDGVRNLMDAIAWASYGAFAHLVTAEDRHRARSVLREVMWLRLALASLAAATVVAVNQPFVSLLFGPENFGGLGLTLAFGLQMVFGGQAFLANYLVRAAGRVREGSYLLGAEAVVRVALMTAGLATIGLSGAPMAAVISSAGGLFVMLRLLDHDLPGDVAPQASAMTSYALPFLLMALGLGVAMLEMTLSWWAVLGRAAIVAAVGGFVLRLAMPVEVAGGAVLRWRT